MSRRDVEADILGRLEAFVVADGQIPATRDGKVNVVGLCRALGLLISDAQHFHRKESIKTAVNALAAQQGLLEIGARGALDPDELALEKRIAQVATRSRDADIAAEETSAAMSALAAELKAAQEEIARLKRDKEALEARLRLIEEQGLIWASGGAE